MKAAAPGKIIISGEHAVVYGNTALVMAVNRFATAKISERQDDQFLFSLPDYHYQKQFSASDLVVLKKLLDNRYARFIARETDASTMTTTPVDIFAYSWELFREQFSIYPETGLDFVIESELPPGGGMGSSAATIAAFIRVCAGYFEIAIDPGLLYSLVLAGENLAHGHSSGVDPYIAVNGGFHQYRQKKSAELLKFSTPFYIVYTGKPAASTGESVEYVNKHYADSAIWLEFQAVTESIQQSLLTNEPQQLIAGIRKNHDLLCRIGVVPDRVKQFIQQVELANGAAKISGAGSVRGEHAGIAIVFGDSPKEICEKYQYQILPVIMEPFGARII